MTPYDLRFPDYLDDYEGETEAKGYLVDVVVIAEGRIIELTIYDRERIAQEIVDELESDRAYLAIHNLLVVPSVTKLEISRAVDRLAETGFGELTPNRSGE